MPRKIERRELFTYTESEVKEICWKLLNDVTNPEYYIPGYKDDFERWFKSNKK